MKRPLLNEKKLLALIALGDQRAFEVIFHHYRHKIYAYAFHILQHKDGADELIQDVFLKVWLSRSKIPDIADFDAWLFTIARNRIFDMLKGIARDYAFRTKIADAGPANAFPDAGSVEDQLIEKENERLLRHALERLSPRQQQIFNLSRRQGMKHEEIASRLHISRNTVKTHLVQALKILRDTLPLHSDSIALVWLFCCYYCR